MLVDNALNSALFNVWSWNNGMLLLDSCSLLRLFKSKSQTSSFDTLVTPVSRNSSSYFSKGVTVNSLRPQTLQPWNLQLCVRVVFCIFFSFLMNYSVTYLILFFRHTCLFNSCFFTVRKWSKWKALFCTLIKTMRRVSATEGNPLFSHKHVFFIVAHDQ